MLASYGVKGTQNKYANMQMYLLAQSNDKISRLKSSKDCSLVQVPKARLSASHASCQNGRVRLFGGEKLDSESFFASFAHNLHTIDQATALILLET